MVVTTALRGVSLCLAGLFLLAVIHKVRVLRAGEASSQPLIRLGGWRERHAATAIALAALAELALAVALVVAPAVGYAGAAIVLAAYSWELRRLPRDQPCGCFGEVLETRGRAVALRRNLLLCAWSGVAFLAYATGAAEVGAISEESVGSALIVTAAFAGAEAGRRWWPRNRGAETLGDRGGQLVA